MYDSCCDLSPVQYLRKNYSVVCELLEPVIPAKAKVSPVADAPTNTSFSCHGYMCSGHKITPYSISTCAVLRGRSTYFTFIGAIRH